MMRINAQWYSPAEFQLLMIKIKISFFLTLSGNSVCYRAPSTCCFFKHSLWGLQGLFLPEGRLDPEVPAKTRTEKTPLSITHQRSRYSSVASLRKTLAWWRFQGKGHNKVISLYCWRTWGLSFMSPPLPLTFQLQVGHTSVTADKDLKLQSRSTFHFYFFLFNCQCQQRRHSWFTLKHF